MTIAPGIIIGNWYQLADGRYFQIDSYIKRRTCIIVIFSDGTEDMINLKHWYDLEPMPLSNNNGRVTPFGTNYETIIKTIPDKNAMVAED